MSFDDAEMLAQALKGFLAGLGSGSGITRSVQPISTEMITEHRELFTGQLLAAIAMSPPGSIVTVASKVAAIVECRVISSKSVTEAVAAGVSVADLLEVLQRTDPSFTIQDVIMMDHYQDDTWILGINNPNLFAHDFSSEVYKMTGARVDVVVCDSGSGRDKGKALIGCPTFMNTPVGATRGVSLVHAQRCAVVAEVIGNAKELTPFTVIAPESWRSGSREHVGEFRYDGYLDATKESDSLPMFVGRR